MTGAAAPWYRDGAFPFWPKHLASPESWDAVALECEGVRREPASDERDEAPLVPFEQIEAWSRS